MSYKTGETRVQDALAYGLQVSGCWQHGTVLRTLASITATIWSVEKLLPNIAPQDQRRYVHTRTYSNVYEQPWLKTTGYNSKVACKPLAHLPKFVPCQSATA